MVEHGRAWWSVVEYGRVWWSVMEHGRAWWSMVEYGRIWWSMVERDGVWWGMEYGGHRQRQEWLNITLGAAATSHHHLRNPRVFQSFALLQIFWGVLCTRICCTTFGPEEA